MEVPILRTDSTCVDLPRSDTSSSFWSPFGYINRVCYHRDANCKGPSKCWKNDDPYHPPEDFSRDSFDDGNNMNDKVNSVQFWHDTQQEIYDNGW